MINLELYPSLAWGDDKAIKIMAIGRRPAKHRQPYCHCS